MKAAWLLGAALLWVGGAGTVAGADRASHLSALFFGDYRTIRALAFVGDSVYAATRGGLVAFRHGAPPTTFGWGGVVDGRGLDKVWSDGKRIAGQSGDLEMAWDGERFTSKKDLFPEVPNRLGFPSDLNPLPPGHEGITPSAFAYNGKSYFLAYLGDGLWRGWGGAWRRVPPPREMRLDHIRAMAAEGDQLAVGTFEGRIWVFRGKRWRDYGIAAGMLGSVYSLASFRNKLVAGTFENGLQAYDGARWKTISAAPHPRDLVVFRNALYIRQSTGTVDRYDGSRVVPNVFSFLPRAEASCLGVGDGKLLVGQYGGWSEYDGAHWAHHLRLGELEGYDVTALGARVGEIWIGTQERGLFRFDRSSERVTGFDQRQGLGDDWIRRIDLGLREPTVGLFRRGAYVLRKENFDRLTPEISDEATGMARDPATNTLYVASRRGLYRIDANGSSLVSIEGVSSWEIQAMHGTREGLWMGLPNGLIFAPWATIGRVGATLRRRARLN